MLWSKYVTKKSQKVGPLPVFGRIDCWILDCRIVLNHFRHALKGIGARILQLGMGRGGGVMNKSYESDIQFPVFDLNSLNNQFPITHSQYWEDFINFAQNLG